MFFSKGIKLINTIAKIEVLRGGAQNRLGLHKKNWARSRTQNVLPFSKALARPWQLQGVPINMGIQ